MKYQIRYYLTIGNTIGNTGEKIMVSKIGIIVMIACTGLLSGCASIGSFNGFSSNPMSKLVVVKYPFGNNVPYITKYEWRVISGMAKTCQMQIDPQMSSPAESAVATAGSYGIAGAIGVGAGSTFLPGTVLKQYLGYGGAAGAVTGGAYGLTMWSFADVSAVASCARDFVRRAGLKDIFIYPSYVRAIHSNEPVRQKKVKTVILRNSGETSESILLPPVLPP